MAYISKKIKYTGKNNFEPIEKAEVIEKLTADYKHFPEISDYPELFSHVYRNIVNLIYETDFKYDITCQMNCAEGAIFELAHKKMAHIGFGKNKIKSEKRKPNDEIPSVILRKYLGEIVDCNPNSIGQISVWIDDNIGEEIKNMDIGINY